MSYHVTALLIGLGLSVAFASEAMAADTSSGKGAWQLIKASRLKTAQQVRAVEPGDMVVMSCPKCKTVLVTVVQKEPKANVTREVGMEKHLCPGCKTSFTIKGHGKAKTREAVHECVECGSKSASCSVVKKGQLPADQEEHPTAE